MFSDEVPALSSDNIAKSNAWSCVFQIHNSTRIRIHVFQIHILLRVQIFLHWSECINRRWEIKHFQTTLCCDCPCVSSFPAEGDWYAVHSFRGKLQGKGVILFQYVAYEGRLDMAQGWIGGDARGKWLRWQTNTSAGALLLDSRCTRDRHFGSRKIKLILTREAPPPPHRHPKGLFCFCPKNVKHISFIHLYSGSVDSLREFITNCVVEALAYWEASDLVAKSYVRHQIHSQVNARISLQVNICQFDLADFINCFWWHLIALY